MASVLLLLLAWVAVWSLMAFLAAAADKRRAQSRGRRIRERTLLGLAFLGGSPGLALAMLAFRHKTRKTGFLARFALVIVVQAVALLIYARGP